ncbi:hypothetical protein [Exiguobacterium sp. JLM-2]|uniref:hypothetical protein n=1 Tax=Exiguobacterium sp. JLM-2 TaxID=1647415 RepID=UPI000649D0F3|nr:hypothetical protein [Exiguobacterium sp. JLM-2]
MITTYRQQYEVIMDSPPGRQRDLRLAALMTDMERHFRIPAMQNKQWEASNPAVADLYREVSYARAL